MGTLEEERIKVCASLNYFATKSLCDIGNPCMFCRMVIDRFKELKQ